MLLLISNLFHHFLINNLWHVKWMLVSKRASAKMRSTFISWWKWTHFLEYQCKYLVSLGILCQDLFLTIKLSDSNSVMCSSQTVAKIIFVYFIWPSYYTSILKIKRFWFGDWQQMILLLMKLWHYPGWFCPLKDMIQIIRSA